MLAAALMKPVINKVSRNLPVFVKLLYFKKKMMQTSFNSSNTQGTESL